MDPEISYSFGHELADAQCLLYVEPRGKGYQAAAVDARRDVARAAQAGGHDMRHAANRRIAGGAAKGGGCRGPRASMSIANNANAALFPLRHRPIALQQLLEIRQGETAPSGGRRGSPPRSADALTLKESRVSLGSMRRRSPASR